MKTIAITLAASLALAAPAAAKGLQSQVAHAARAHGVPPALAHGVVMAESRYDCRASSGVAHGIMQVKPATARGVGVRGSLFNCSTGIEAGMRYLRQALRMAGGDWCGAASLFNRGTGARPSCTGYGRKVLAYARGA